MSSEATETLLNLLDGASDFATLVASSKPAFRLVNNYLPSTQLARGDQYQESTLRLLEATHKIMPPQDHAIHHREYELIRENRDTIVLHDLKKTLENAKHAREYKRSAKELNGNMRRSSQQARSKSLWSIKGMQSSTSNSNSPASPQAAVVDSEGMEITGPAKETQSSSEDITEAMYRLRGLDQTDSVVSIIDPFRETDSVIVSDYDATLHSGHWESIIIS